ncbi:hypothetical protein HRR83_005801 [Exophiala dermatitidis]|nr:hypothetical protein HRR73_007376 [Exophiala dermatitidis]KAJ4513358.1 hypothetical protein HRR74_006170 [Exophiala dermatitidis]KAJ4538091.1 hypothetical protein HRR77_007131 [Exophiala dermatitidis]KAJ4539824.1 hypothetical protein HRR76_003258 [Exophiala dermatitidis]KAJ4562383.1 hypothetical protein HRR79_006710 [Exophiala dermatitidis]
MPQPRFQGVGRGRTLDSNKTTKALIPRFNFRRITSPILLSISKPSSNRRGYESSQLLADVFEEIMAECEPDLPQYADSLDSSVISDSLTAESGAVATVHNVASPDTRAQGSGDKPSHVSKNVGLLFDGF